VRTQNVIIRLKEILSQNIKPNIKQKGLDRTGLSYASQRAKRRVESTQFTCFERSNHCLGSIGRPYTQTKTHRPSSHSSATTAYASPSSAVHPKHDYLSNSCLHRLTTKYRIRDGFETNTAITNQHPTTPFPLPIIVPPSHASASVRMQAQLITFFHSNHAK
jgi:hypothetical protein